MLSTIADDQFEPYLVNHAVGHLHQNAALRIPQAYMRAWAAEPAKMNGPNPYHGVGISPKNSAENFAFMFGLAGDGK